MSSRTRLIAPLVGRVLEDDQQQHAGQPRRRPWPRATPEPRRSAPGAGAPAAFAAASSQTTTCVTTSIIRCTPGRAAGPRPASRPRPTLSFFSSFSMQSAMNSSTLLYPAAAAARFARSKRADSILILSMRYSPLASGAASARRVAFKHGGLTPRRSPLTRKCSCRPSRTASRARTRPGSTGATSTSDGDAAAHRPVAEQHAGHLERVGAVVGAPGRVVVEQDRPRSGRPGRSPTTRGSRGGSRRSGPGARAVALPE